MKNKSASHHPWCLLALFSLSIHRSLQHGCQGWHSASVCSSHIKQSKTKYIKSMWSAQHRYDWSRSSSINAGIKPLGIGGISWSASAEWKHDPYSVGADISWNRCHRVLKSIAQFDIMCCLVLSHFTVLYVLNFVQNGTWGENFPTKSWKIHNILHRINWFPINIQLDSSEALFGPKIFQNFMKFSENTRSFRFANFSC